MSGVEEVEVDLSLSLSNSGILYSSEEEEEEEGNVDDVDLSVGMDGLHLDSVSSTVQEFLKPLKEAILSKKEELDKPKLPKMSKNTKEVPVHLLKSLCHFIWEPNVIYTDKGFLQKCYNQLQYYFTLTDKQSDLDDMLDYKPTELLGAKASQVFIALVLPNPTLFKKNLSTFKLMFEDNRIATDGRAESAYVFLYNMFRSLYNILAEEDEEEVDLSTTFQDLNLASQCVIQGLSVYFIKMFKIKSLDRIKRMITAIGNDPASVEWCLMLGETMRLRRHDATGINKWASSEEMKLLNLCVQMAPENPYVRLAVLDTIIGNVRDSSGRFHCGELRLESREEAMLYLTEHCRKLVEDFPKNVYFQSIVSDYFARYFPHTYLDPNVALKLLRHAYKLNELHPKTTHRFGIIWRMSFGDCLESIKWLERTVELDPTYFPASLEYYKTLMGSGGCEIDSCVTDMMQNFSESEASQCWTDVERAEFNFYLGIAHFADGNNDEVIECWKHCINVYEPLFQLEDVRKSSEHFQWDSKIISVDKIKQWLLKEKESFAAKEKAGESFDAETKAFFEKAFGIAVGFVHPSKPTIQYHIPNKFPANFVKDFIPDV